MSNNKGDAFTLRKNDAFKFACYSNVIGYVLFIPFAEAKSLK